LSAGVTMVKPGRFKYSLQRLREVIEDVHREAMNEHPLAPMRGLLEQLGQSLHNNLSWLSALDAGQLPQQQTNDAGK
jgi:hypothetical protein